MKFALVSVLCALALDFSATSASAQDVTISFSGTLSTVKNSPFDDVAVGTPFNGTYTFSLATEDSNPIEQVGGFRHTSAPYGVTVTIGTHTFRTDPANIDFLVELVNDYYALDNFVFHSYRNVATDDVPVDMISCQLDDPTHAILESAALTSTPPDLARWQQWIGLDISGGTEESRFVLRGTVQSVQADSSPF